jgi:hypothetical protein
MGDGKAAAAVSVTLQLEGILYETGHPAAIVSGHILTLNKTVTIGDPGNGGVQLKAVEITRDRALVEMGGQKIELLLNRPNGL